MDNMAEVVALSAPGTVFLDARGAERALRVTWHHEVDTVVLSLWQFDRCVSSFRLTADEVPELVRSLVEGLGAYVSKPR
jgi:hypothetical protein